MSDFPPTHRLYSDFSHCSTCPCSKNFSGSGSNPRSPVVFQLSRLFSPPSSGSVLVSLCPLNVDILKSWGQLLCRVSVYLGLSDTSCDSGYGWGVGIPQKRCCILLSDRIRQQATVTCPPYWWCWITKSWTCPPSFSAVRSLFSPLQYVTNLWRDYVKLQEYPTSFY